jgi:transposase
MDLRERVVAAVDAGLSQSQAAARFGVSLRTVERYLARRRATGSLAATVQRHGPEPTVRRRLPAWLPARLETAADATLDEHAAAFVAAGGPRVSLASMSRAISTLPPPARGGADPGRAAAGGAAAEAQSLTATERDEGARARWGLSDRLCKCVIQR